MIVFLRHRKAKVGSNMSKHTYLHRVVIVFGAVMMILDAPKMTFAKGDMMMTSAAITTPVTEISQYNVTFTFAKPCVVGQYATGDYWVVGPVEVSFPPLYRMSLYHVV